MSKLFENVEYGHSGYSSIAQRRVDMKSRIPLRETSITSRDVAEEIIRKQLDPRKPMVIYYGETKEKADNLDYQIPFEEMHLEDRVTVTKDGHVAFRQLVNQLYLGNLLEAIRNRRKTLRKVKTGIHKMDNRLIIKGYRDMLDARRKEPETVPVAFDMFRKELGKRNPAMLRELEEKYTPGAFECQHCGWCCRNVNINIAYSDILRWSKEQRLDILSEVRYIDNEDPKKKGFYITKTVTAPKQPCPFLKDNSCTIHDTLPRACREFPMAYSEREKALTNCPAKDFQLDEKEAFQLKKDQAFDFVLAEDRKEKLSRILGMVKELKEFGEDPTETLKVTTMGAEKTAWTEVGTLHLQEQDEPTHYIWTTTKKSEHGDFDFANTAHSSDTLNSVTLYIYHKNADGGRVLEFHIWDGTDWTEYNLTPGTSYGWQNIAVPVLDTWIKVDGAKLYVKQPNQADRTDIDAAYLLCDYTTAGDHGYATMKGDAKVEAHDIDTMKGGVDVQAHGFNAALVGDAQVEAHDIDTMKGDLTVEGHGFNAALVGDAKVEAHGFNADLKGDAPLTNHATDTMKGDLTVEAHGYETMAGDVPVVYHGFNAALVGDAKVEAHGFNADLVGGVPIEDHGFAVMQGDVPIEDHGFAVMQGDVPIEDHGYATMKGDAPLANHGIDTIKGDLTVEEHSYATMKGNAIIETDGNGGTVGHQMVGHEIIYGAGG